MEKSLETRGAKHLEQGEAKLIWKLPQMPLDSYLEATSHLLVISL